MRWRRPGRPAPRQAAGERGRNAGPGGGAGPGSLARRRAGRRTAPWRPPVRGTVGPQRPRCAAAPSATPHLTNRSRAELTSPGAGMADAENPAQRLLDEEFPPGLRPLVPPALKRAYNAVDRLIETTEWLDTPSGRFQRGDLIVK